MRIMYLLYSFTIGGTEKLISDICNQISKENDVYLFIVNDHYDEEMLSMVSSNVCVTLYGRKKGANNKLSIMIDIYRFCKTKNIDVIHCNALNTPELLIITKMLLKNTKIVYTIHGVGQYAALNRMRVAYRNMLCDSIIAISKSVYDDVVSNGADSKKTHIVYNAINIDLFKSNEHRSNSSTFIIGNVARIDISKKGQDILLEALSIIKDKCNFKCIFAGAPSEGTKEEFQRLKDRAKNDFENCGSEVNFIGSITDVPQFLKNIDMFILPSRFEGFGISLVEAMCMGVPCISSDINGPREIVGDNERGYLFESGSPQKLAEKILYVMDNYDEALIKANLAKEYVIENFDIRNMCTKLMQIYKRIS